MLTVANELSRADQCSRRAVNTSWAAKHSLASSQAPTWDCPLHPRTWSYVLSREPPTDGFSTSPSCPWLHRWHMPKLGRRQPRQTEQPVPLLSTRLRASARMSRRKRTSVHIGDPWGLGPLSSTSLAEPMLAGKCRSLRQSLLVSWPTKDFGS